MCLNRDMSFYIHAYIHKLSTKSVQVEYQKSNWLAMVHLHGILDSESSRRRAPGNVCESVSRDCSAEGGQLREVQLWVVLSCREGTRIE